MPSTVAETPKKDAIWTAAQIGDHLDIGLALFAADGRIKSWNRWLAEGTGIAEDTAVGQRLDEVIPGLTGHLLVTCIDQALEAGMSAFLSHRLHPTLLPLTTRRDGKSEPMSQNIVVKALGPPGRGAAALVQVFDVSGTVKNETELRRRKRQLDSARQQAEEASQAKTLFLTNVSHELRTPLNAVIGFAELLRTEQQHPPTPEQVEMIDMIGANGRRLLALIGDLLELSRIEGGSMTLSMEPIDLSPLLLEVHQNLELLGRKSDIMVDSDLPPPGRWTVKADRLRLGQVLSNFGSNAIKYNRPNGRVGISCQETSQETLRITVSDTGRGLSKTARQDLFKPFQRLGQERGSIEGTGIGLAISKRLSELMGTPIGVDSEVDVGSRFWIDLPLVAPADIAPTVDKVATTSAASVKEKSILYVEDNPSNMMLMERIIARLPGATLIKAVSGSEGLEIAHAARPVAIVLDIDLPGMDGYEVLRRLRADPTTAAIPVMALTAAAMARDIKRGREAGFFAYMTKPIDIPAFLGTLAKAVGVDD